ncbi:molybdate ABC transporter substrate-binding protein [Pseudoprimorskyibacter insulae]|uniref:Molybdate-binding periplasmic protein n=1 Tax=Pseudoprimorskyibacter insulae TaxID=1695997 RepID=A0A2R8AQX3_9RHOB|nr:molybdate ABC transporter substrate-binding protein [Pseudoprimorskyibacter insulae]SPF78234.1 Molybdate-binding periplasmic protein [Pseudoprimorskyibacter insulae]
MLRALALAALTLAAAPAQAERLTVFAAASTKTALDAIAGQWQAQTGHQVSLSYAGSSALARQIEFGAPADLFLSASPDWMDQLETKGLLAADTRFDLLGNDLALIAHGTQPTMAIADLPDRLGDDRLAMAHVDAVPAGIYGKAALENLGLWAALAPHVAQTDNVRAALTLVATGEAPFGITYTTDAAASADVSIVYTFPADSHPPITYPIAAIAGGNTRLGAEFLSYLRGPEARAAFTAEGFEVLAE